MRLVRNVLAKDTFSIEMSILPLHSRVITQFLCESDIGGFDLHQARFVDIVNRNASAMVDVDGFSAWGTIQFGRGHKLGASR